MSKKPRDEQGRFDETFTDAELLDLIASDGSTMPELADALGVTRNSIQYRLERLVDEGKVIQRDLGNTYLWFVAEDDAE